MFRALAGAARRRQALGSWEGLGSRLEECAAAWAAVPGPSERSAAAGPRHHATHSHYWQHAKSGNGTNGRWDLLHEQGYNINPCNSKLHPAVTEAGIAPESEEEVPVQEAYTPESSCYGCGPAAEDGLHLRSFRIPGGLEASVVLDRKYCAFPGIINGGIITSLFDCQGNWAAALALMDKGCLPMPPLTLTYEMLVTFKEPTPPGEPLVLRSQITRVKDSGEVGSKATVQVDTSLYQAIGGHEKLLATSTGIFKKLGALRAL